MMHFRTRQILASVLSAALLLTLVPSGIWAGETADDEVLFSMQKEITSFAGEVSEPVSQEESDTYSQAVSEEAAEPEAAVPEEAGPEDEELLLIGEDEDAYEPDGLIVEDLVEDTEAEGFVEDEEILQSADDNRSGQVTLKVAGEESELTLPVNKGFDVILTADKPIRAIRVDAGDHWWYGGDQFGPDNPRDAWFEEGNYVMHDSGGGYGGSGEYEFYAQVLLEGNDDWITSNKILITAEKIGDIGSFSFSLDTPAVKRGEMARVTFQPSENADHYWVDVEKWDGSEWQWFDGRANMNPDPEWDGTAYIATADMEPGRYQISGQANGIGYQGRGADNGPFELTVTETDITQGSVSLQVGKKKLKTGEDYNFSVYAPGAYRIELFFDYANGENWWNDCWEESWTGTRDYRNEGTYQLVARAHYRSADGSETTKDSEQVTIEVEAPNGSLDAVMPEMPAYLTLGETGLDFIFTRPANAEGMEAEVWYDPAGGGDSITLFRANTDENPAIDDKIHASVSKDQIAKAGKGNCIKVSVKAWAFGYDESRQQWDIPVVAPAATDMVTISIDPAEAEVNEDIHIRVTPVNGGDTIRALRIWDDGGYWEWGNEINQQNHGNWFDNNGNFDTWHSWNRSGQKSLYAEVTFDDFGNNNYDGNGNDRRTWYNTEVKNVIVTSRGTVGSFHFSLDTDNVKRGEMAQVTYGSSEHANHYWVDLEKWFDADEDHDRPGWYWIEHYADADSAGTVSFGTAELEPGTYRVYASADGIGYQSRDAESGPFDLTVTDSDIKEGEILLTIDKTEVKTREDYSFSVYAPGADWIEVAFDYDHMENWQNGWINDNGGGESWAQTRSYGSSGTYRVVARAHYDTKGSEWTAESNPAEIKVTAPNGPLSVSLPDALPAYLTTEDELSFIAQMPDHAERLQVDVWYDTDGDGNLFDDDTEEASLPVTITKEQLKKVGVGNSVRIAVSAEAAGYDGARVECAIPVIDAPEISKLSIEADKTTGVLVNEDVHIIVSPGPEGTKIRAVRFFDGRGFWENGNEIRPEWNQDRFDGNGCFNVYSNWWEPGRYSVYAMVTFDEWDDKASGGDGGRTWYTTDVLQITVEKKGDVGSFTYSLDKDCVARGELIQVTYGLSQNADHYWIDIEQLCEDEETGDTWWNYIDHKADRIGSPGAAGFGTANLEPGEYRIVAKANGIGYEGRDADNEGYLTVTESETAEGNVCVNVSKTQLDTCENFAVSVLAPGAQWIDLFYDYKGDGNWWNWHSVRGGDSLEEQQNYGHSGVYTLAARAHYYAADEYGNPLNHDEYGNPTDEIVKVSAPITMTVTASQGKALSIAPPVFPKVLSAGDDLRFTVTKPGNADWVQVSVWYDPDENNANGNIYDDWREENSFNVNIPPEQLAAVKDGKFVKVRIYANAPGYEDAEEYAEIPVVPAADTGKVVINVDKKEVKVNEGFNIIVSPKDASVTGPIRAVRFFGGRGYFNGGDEFTPGMEGWFDEDGNFTASQGFREPGTYSVFAVVTFDVQNTKGEDTRTWYTTEKIDITVTSDGELKSPEFRLDKERIGRQDTVTGSIKPAKVDHAAEYWLWYEKWYEAGEDVDHREAGWDYVWQGDTLIFPDEKGFFPIPAETMPAGDYRLYVYVFGEEGYRSCDANDGVPVVLKIRDPYLTEQEEAAAEELKAIINDLPFTAGTANEASVARAKEILDNLSDAQKAYLGEKDAVEQFADTIGTAQGQVDQAKANDVINQINALPDGAGLAQKDAVKAAGDAYAALSDAQKALVDANSGAKKKLTDAQDKVAAETVAEKLNALKANAGLADQAAVEAARKAYNNLTESQKKLVSAAALNRLTSAEASVKKAKDAAEAAKKKAEEEIITISKNPTGVKAKADGKGKVTLTWKAFKQTKKTKPIWTKVKKIEIQYSTDKTFKQGVVTKQIGKKKTKLVVKKLTAKTTYFFRVRYIESKGKVSKWSAVKKVKVK